MDWSNEEAATGRWTRLATRLEQLGPALVLAAVVVGPGSIALSTIAGSLYGYQLLWVPVVATTFMIVYTWMAARIGLVTGKTLFQATRERFGATVATLGGLAGFLTILAFQAGNTAGIAFAANALFGFDVRLWALLFTAVAFGFVLLPNLYDKLELLVKVVVSVMLVSFVGTLALVGIDLQAAAAGLVPGFPDRASIFLTLGMAATTFSIAAAVYQTHLMREKEWGPERLGVEGADTVIGIALLGGIAMVVLLTSASVIHGTGDAVFSAQAMASQLEPLAGPGAFYLFTIGFFFASLSSLVVNALIGATLLVDGLGKSPAMDGRPVKQWTGVAMAVGLAVVVLFGGSPVELLRVAQGLAIVAFPILGFLVLALANSERLMGDHTNGTVVNALGALGYLVIVAIVGNYLREVVTAL
ncbi:MULTISPECIES: Nramp family divalent metal transporter [unclassified Haladaptatus]|uniref:Nramp family divalent metal transporter n=1 Tax=unclassified Haladaptatus TaxID=2622732 RepID=UPI0023E875FF|nr:MULTISPECIES: Nramp family divalent metal transporter [unclassified Haladaptatus]